VSVIRGLVAQSRNPLGAVYRGLTPNLLGNATSWASFFFFKSGIERAIATLKTQRPDGGRVQWVDVAALTPTDFFLSSLLAGAMTQVITNPIWVLKTRMLSSDASTAGAYPSMWSGAARLYREEGLWGFYRGLGVGMLAVSHGAVQFAVYEPAKRVYFASRDRRAANAEGRSPDQHRERDGALQPRMSNEATIILSTVSKLIAGAATYPLQVLRSRLQNYDAEERFGRGVRGVVARLWAEEGIRGFYRGLVPGVIRVLPATWVTFLVYENVKYFLPRWAAGELVEQSDTK
jgi:solute carrier family 25 (mitochondrial folate transporter), member 32